MEAAFPYEETPDQLRAVIDVKSDLERDTPMDRLVVGDVGYGKTEVALRAAFKAIGAGTQVAVLVPTTVLAAQHLVTFSQRFAAYPISVRSLSRFVPRKEQQDTLAGLAAGTVDLVIGTHRLLEQGHPVSATWAWSWSTRSSASGSRTRSASSSSRPRCMCSRSRPRPSRGR